MQNSFKFIKHYCKQGNSKRIIIGNCSIKTAGHIGSDTIQVNIDATIPEPLNELYVHTVFYYKYTTFRKFPIDLWEELCGWLNGKTKSFYLDAAMSKTISSFEHNGPRACPLIGHYAMRIPNISFAIFKAPSLMPAGRYRIDVNLTENDRNNVIAVTSFQVSVSDLRIEQV